MRCKRMNWSVRLICRVRNGWTVATLISMAVHCFAVLIKPLVNGAAVRKPFNARTRRHLWNNDRTEAVNKIYVYSKFRLDGTQVAVS